MPITWITLSGKCWREVAAMLGCGWISVFVCGWLFSHFLGLVAAAADDDNSIGLLTNDKDYSRQVIK